MRVLGKNVGVRATAMQKLSSIVEEALKEAGVEAELAKCRLLHKNTTLDLQAPFRFANIPTGSKLRLLTGPFPPPAPASFCMPTSICCQSASPLHALMHSTLVPSASILVLESPATSKLCILLFCPAAVHSSANNTCHSTSGTHLLMYVSHCIKSPRYGHRQIFA